MLARYVAGRLLLIVPTMFGVAVATFVLLRVLPGDPTATILGQSATDEEIAAARARFGLDQSLPRQFWNYMTGLLRGDLGVSVQSGKPVRTELLERLAPTLELVIISLVIAALIALIFGIWSSLNVNRLPDQVVRVASLIGNSLPAFWVGLLLIIVFYAKLGWAPAPNGRVDSNADLVPMTGSGLIDSLISWNMPALRSVLAHLALPVTTLVISITAPLLRSVRASSIEVQGAESYATAEAHGISGRLLRRKYLMRPTLVRLPTLAALVFGYTLGSVVLVEQVFAWQGIGQWALRGVLYRDYAVVQAAVLMMALVFTVGFAIADIVHGLLDPRVRL